MTTQIDAARRNALDIAGRIEAQVAQRGTGLTQDARRVLGEEANSLRALGAERLPADRNLVRLDVAPTDEAARIDQRCAEARRVARMWGVSL